MYMYMIEPNENFDLTFTHLNLHIHLLEQRSPVFLNRLNKYEQQI